MKHFKAAAQRATAFVLAASMMSSAVLPTVFAAQPLNAENSVDELGNEDLSDETDTALDETADAADHTWGEWYDGTYQEGEDGKIQRAKMARFRMSRFGSVLIAEFFNWRMVRF